MNRKVELILGWIACGLSMMYLIMSLISYFTVRQNSNTEQYQQMLKQVGNQDVKVTPEMINFAMTFLWEHLFSQLFRHYWNVYHKGRPILAGSLLIVAALVGIFNMSLIAGVLWIVVAIMLFVKRIQINLTKSQNQSSHQWMTGNLKGLIMIVKDDPYIY